LNDEENEALKRQVSQCDSFLTDLPAVSTSLGLNDDTFCAVPIDNNKAQNQVINTSSSDESIAEHQSLVDLLSATHQTA
jgi:hypothetical protein